MSSGRVVAELGRPETPEETAERKARESRLYRERKTLSNLLYALLATLAAVALIVIAVPHPSKPIDRTVDAAAVASKVAGSFGATPMVPTVTGQVNAAEIRTSADGVTAWYIGWITPDNEYLGMLQAVNANPSWVSNEMAEARPTGTIELGGLNWTVYNNRDASGDVGNARFGLATEYTAADGTTQTLLLFGTAADEQFVTAATAMANAIRTIS